MTDEASALIGEVCSRLCILEESGRRPAANIRVRRYGGRNVPCTSGRVTMELTRTPSFRLDGRRALARRRWARHRLGGGVGAGRRWRMWCWPPATATEIAEAANAIRARRQRIRSRLTFETWKRLNDCRRAEPFDILVNDAGTNRPAPFVDVKVRISTSCSGLNMRAAYFLAQAVERGGLSMPRSPAPSSTCRRRWAMSAPTRTVYCATKHAMEGFTKAMAIELAPYKIRVNTLAPTFIDTPMTRPFFQNEAFRTDTLNRIKLGRLGQLEDLTGAIVFLASDAAALMTGTSLVVDGGWTAE